MFSRGDAVALADVNAQCGRLHPSHQRGVCREAACRDAGITEARTENFGIAVAEALAAGLPVITTKGTPWTEIEGRSGWWVGVNADAIAKALAAAMRLSDAERHTMGQRGRELVAAKYQWDAVGLAMAGVYESLVGR
jgi:glycosyltransferase involved in cell wall biosynthesis